MFCIECQSSVEKTQKNCPMCGAEQPLESDNEMKFDWHKWNIGGQVIFVSTCGAIVSMFMDWVSIGFASQSGLTQGTFLILILWIYPVLKLFKKEIIDKFWGFVCSLSSIALTIAYISSKSIELLGNHLNAAATGAWLFLLLSVSLMIGIIKYQETTD